jgi:xylulokinase
VYWKKGAEKMLGSLNPAKFLHDELSNAFSIKNSPVWMDSSTTEQCRAFTDAIGSPEVN